MKMKRLSELEHAERLGKMGFTIEVKSNGLKICREGKKNAPRSANAKGA